MLDIISNLQGFSALISTTADVHVRPLSPSLLSFRYLFHYPDKNSQHRQIETFTDASITCF